MCGLTERESDVARLVAAGYTDKDVARTLGIGVPTVRTHLRRVMAKKGVANRASGGRAGVTGCSASGGRPASSIVMMGVKIGAPTL